MKPFWRASFAVMLVGVMTVASACGGTTKTNDKKTTAEPAPAKQVTLRLGTWDSGDGVKAHQEIINNFQNSHPNIKVQLESVPDDYGTKLLTQMSAGTAPDVFQVGDGDVGMFVKKGVVEDLSAYGIDKGIYYPNVYDVGVVDGKPYFLTKDYSPLAVYYNKALFDKAGVAYPKDGWTWDDFLNAAKKLTDPANKVWGVDATGSWLRALEPWILSNNGKVISADGTKYDGALNSKETVDAVQWWVDLYRVHKVAPTAADKESLKNIDLFANGKVAMSITGRWPLDGYKANTALKFGVVGLPKKQTATNILCWAGFGVNAKSANKKEAVEFLKYLAGPEGAKVFSKWAIPAVKSVAEETGFTKDEYNKVFVDALANVKPFGAKYNYLYGQTGEKFLQPAIDELLLKGGDVKAKLDQAVKDAEKELKDLNSK
jgi:multiple sugar transport system substrate-binding protein